MKTSKLRLMPSHRELRLQMLNSKICKC